MFVITTLGRWDGWGWVGTGGDGWARLACLACSRSVKDKDTSPKIRWTVPGKQTIPEAAP